MATNIVLRRNLVACIQQNVGELPSMYICQAGAMSGYRSSQFGAAVMGAMRYNGVSVGATWFRRGLQSSAGHTEGGLPRKYNLKNLTANDNSYALAA